MHLDDIPNFVPARHRSTACSWPRWHSPILLGAAGPPCGARSLRVHPALTCRAKTCDVWAVFLIRTDKPGNLASSWFGHGATALICEHCSARWMCGGIWHQSRGPSERRGGGLQVAGRASEQGGRCHLGPTELPAQLLEELSSGRFTYFVPFIFRTRKISARLRLGQMSLFPRSRAT